MGGMLLRRTTSTGAPGRRELEARLEQFEDGSWEALLAPSLQGQRPPGGAHGAGDAEARRQRLLEDAVALVRADGLSKARQLLASRRLAPGYSSSLSGARFELLKLALDENETLELQAAVAERYARAEITASAARALGTGRLTALLKDNGRARGIVAGDAFRCKALSRQYGSEINNACAPFQHALSTRAGTDSAAHFLRAATDSDPAATIASIDGTGAFDHVRRDRMIEKLLPLPEASAMVPFALLSYSQPSTWSGMLAYAIRDALAASQLEDVPPET
ncbi:unnamed protein product, partial [Prorocentrum cordatum]